MKKLLSALKAFSALSVILATLTLAATNASEPKTILSWDFNAQEDVDAWSFNCITKPVVKEGTLASKYTSWDPFVVSPQFNFKPRTGQYVEIRMKSTGFHTGEIFYASSNEGKFNGFSQDKTASWEIVHDGKWHTYQIMPGWLKEPQIIKIRVDLGRPTEEEIKKNADFQIDYIRILDVDVANAKPLTTASWDSEELKNFESDSSADLNGWISDIGAIMPEKVGSNLYLEFERVASNEDSMPYPRAKLRFLTDVGNGIIDLQVPLFNLSDSGNNSFAKNVDLTAFGNWSAPAKDPNFKVFRWELNAPKEFVLKKLALTKEPIGKGVIETQGNGSQTAIARLTNGKATIQYETIVRNSGGEPLKKFQLNAPQKATTAKLTAVTAQKAIVDPLLGFNPTGDRLASKGLDGAKEGRPFDVRVDDSGTARFPKDVQLLPGEAFRILSTYETENSGTIETELKLSASEQQVLFIPKLNVLPQINVPKMDYVEAPKKIESDYEIGAYYFPGWSSRSGWDKIDEAAPIRKPLLGYYDEANPEVVDWQIKWAAENGIQFFFVDWYWKHGKVSLEHWVRAFQKAKYRSNLKWAVMWANHTGYGTHSTEDWKVVTQYWIDNYFNTPEYYSIDGKPVVVIWDHSIVDHDMIEEAAKEGVELKPGEGCKRAFDIVRKICVEAGFPGVYFIAIKWPEHAVDPETVQKYADAGFDATTIYHFMYGGKELKDPRLYSFEQVADASKPNWDERAKTGILPSIPNISTGWDSRPWHGFRNTVIYDRSVEAFRRILKDYKQYAEETGNKRVVLAPLNEWGEGSYIEPNNEFGFGMYEAIREELCKEPEDGFPVNYAPYEVGLGPYDLPKE